MKIQTNYSLKSKANRAHPDLSSKLSKKKTNSERPYWKFRWHQSGSIWIKTHDFLMDFKNELAQGLRNIFDIPSIPKAPSANASADEDVPVMEVPLPRDSSSENVRATSSKRASLSQEKNIYPDLGRTTSMSFNDLKGKEEAAPNLGLLYLLVTRNLNLLQRIFSRKMMSF